MSFHTARSIPKLHNPHELRIDLPLIMSKQISRISNSPMLLLEPSVRVIIMPGSPGRPGGPGGPDGPGMPANPGKPCTKRKLCLKRARNLNKYLIDQLAAYDFSLWPCWTFNCTLLLHYRRCNSCWFLWYYYWRFSAYKVFKFLRNKNLK